MMHAGILRCLLAPLRQPDLQCDTTGHVRRLARPWGRLGRARGVQSLGGARPGPGAYTV